MPAPLRDIRWSRSMLSTPEARAVADRLGSAAMSGAPAFKKHGRAWVARVDAAGRALLVKCTPVTGLLQRVRVLASGTRFTRHWDSALWLTRHHVRTPAPRLLGSAHDGTGPVELLVLEFLPGQTLLERLADGLSPAQAHRLAGALARQMTRLTRHGRYNRDHKPSNLLAIDEDDRARPGDTPMLISDQDAQVALLDCVGLRTPRRRDPWRGADRMLASMLIEPAGCGVHIRTTDRLRMARALLDAIWRGDGEDGPMPDELHGVRQRDWMRASLRTLWRRVGQIVREHGDPTPAVNPLAHR